MALAAVTLSSHEFSSFAKSLKTADLSGLKIVDGKVDGTVSYKVGIPETRGESWWPPPDQC
jgi:hypothetical protein